MTLKMSAKKRFNKSSSPSIELNDTDCESIGDDSNEQLQCSTNSTSNKTRLRQHDEPKKIIHKLCTSLLKSDCLEDEYEVVEDNEEDRDNYTRAFLGSFTIYKSKPMFSTHLNPVESCLYEPPFRVKKEEMRKAGYWKDWESRFARNVDFSPEDIEEDLISKIETVIEHFENFVCIESTSTENASTDAHHKIDMHKPYLPSPQDLKALESLKIKVDSSGRKFKDIPTTYCSSHSVSEKNYGLFSRREADTMKQNWLDFKREYKFCDLRPLLGTRTLLLQGNAEKFTYCKLQYLSMDQHIAFIKYLGRGLEKRSIHQLYIHAVTTLFGHVSANQNTAKPMSSRELHLMDHFLKKYGLSCQLMEYLLHSKSESQFRRTIYFNYRFRRCPFNSGPWSSSEVLRLLDAISHHSLQPATTQRTALPGVYKSHINWTRVMERVQTRSPDTCGAMFHGLLKQALKSRYYSNANPDKDVHWTAKHELLLIQELCQTTVDSLNRVDFYTLSKRPEFGPFCDDFLKRVARDVINTMVPTNKRHYFDDALDYLAKEVLPVLSKKIEEHNEVFNSRYLSNSKDVLDLFPDYLNKYVIKMFSSLPLCETTNMTQAFQNIDEMVDDPTDSANVSPPINSNAEETRDIVPQNNTDNPPSQHNGIARAASSKRKNQCQLDSDGHNKPKKRRHERKTASDHDVVPVTSRVSTNSPLDVITLE